MSTPGTTNKKKSYTVEPLNPDDFWGGTSDRFNRARVVVRDNFVAVTSKLLPLFRGKIRALEFVHVVDDGYSHETKRSGMTLCDERGHILLHVTGGNIGYEGPEWGVEHAILRKLRIPEKVIDQVRTEARAFHDRSPIVALGHKSTNYAVKLTIS